VRNNEADYRAIIPKNVCLWESRDVSGEFVPRVNESYSLLAIHRKWESANVRNATRRRFAKPRTSRTAEFAVLGHTAGEGDRPLRRERAFSRGSLTGALGQHQPVSDAAQIAPEAVTQGRPHSLWMIAAG